MSFETFKQKRRGNINMVLWLTCCVLLILLIILEIVALKQGTFRRAGGKEPIAAATDTPKPIDTPEVTEVPTPEPTEEPYVWLNEEGTTILERINPPKGYTRVEVDPDSFAAYLQNYPLKPYGEKALLFSGAESDEASTIAVFQQVDELVKNQQCADTAIMLYGEYLYGQQRYDEIVFQFSSGFPCDFEHWAAGYRDKVNGRDVVWEYRAGTGDIRENDYSYENFFKYLKEVYVYANTDSLVTQFPKKSADDLRPGDLIVATTAELKAEAQKVSQEAADNVTFGHAVLVADMAVNEAGEKVFLLIEGTTPATECSVVANPDESRFCWFSFDKNGTFVKTSSGIHWKNTWIYTFETP